MSFTDRFIKLPIQVFDSKLAESIGEDKCEYVDSFIKINPFEISSYKETDSDKFNGKRHTYINMKDGGGFYVFLSIEKFEELLNKFQ
jgi:hypothetical protein